MPTKDELFGIVDLSQASGSKINTSWLPNTQAAFYWSSSPHVSNSYDAWDVYFGYGDVGNGDRGDSYSAVRLVRASQ